MGEGHSCIFTLSDSLLVRPAATNGESRIKRRVGEMQRSLGCFHVGDNDIEARLLIDWYQLVIG